MATTRAIAVHLTKRVRSRAMYGWALLAITTLVLAVGTVGEAVGIASALVVLASGVLVARSTNPFRLCRITIGGFWYLLYCLMIFLPSLFVFAEQDGLYRGRYLFSVESVLITVPAGWLIANRLWKFSHACDDNYFQAPIAPIVGNPKVKRLFLGLLLAAVLLTLLYINQVGTIPLFYLFNNPGDYLQLALLREDSFKLLDTPLLYFYYLVRSVIYPMLILISLGCYLKTRSRGWLYMFIVTAALGVLYSSLSLAKSPVAVICALIGFFIYYYRGGRLPRKVVASLLILTLLFPFAVVMGVSAGNDVGPLEAIEGISARLFYLPAEISYYYFEIFPSYVPYLHGRSIDKLSRLLGMQPFDTPNYVGNYIYPNGIESVSANAVFISDLNADFGLWGVVLGGILTGFIMQSFHVYVMRRRKSVFNIACYSFLVIAFWFLNSTSLTVVLLSDGALIAVLLTFLFDRSERVLPLRLEQSA